MKNIKIKFLGLCLAAGLISCDDQLEQLSPNQPDVEKVWTSKASVEKYMVSAYGQIAPSYSYTLFEHHYVALNNRADDVFLRNSGDSYSLEVAGFTNTSESTTPRYYFWDMCYTGIKLSNDIIDNVPEIKAIPVEEQNELIAEARFLRAWYHLRLVKNFHDVILVTESLKSLEGINKPIATKADVYNSIEEDFKYAAKYLPASRPASYRGRATKNAALAYLGQAHLFENEYQEAEDALKEVTGADLLSIDQYRSMFDGSNESNAEVLFSSGYPSKTNPDYATRHTLSFSLLNWQMAEVSAYALSQFEVSDKRKELSLVENGENLFGKEAGLAHVAPYKGVSEDAWLNWNWCSNDLVLMRYANVILMRAEALNELGSDGEARELINKVRNRAELTDLDASFTGDKLRQAIRKERLVEFIGEGSRYHDLVRWGIVKEQLDMAKHPSAVNFVKGKHEYFPVPFAETEKNPNVDPTPGF